MTISSSVRVAGPYTGTGSVSIYPFSFKVFQASDVLVKQTDLSGNITTLVLTTNYSVSLNSDQNASPGGSINLNSPLPNGYQLVISSQVQELQGTSLTNNGGFYPSVIENALDYLTILVQQAQTEINASLQIPLGGSKYDAGGKGIANGADAVGPTDFTTQQQVDQKVTAAAGGLAPANVALYSTLAASGGSSLVGTIQSGTGAVARTQQEKNRDRINVRDHGALFNGVADDTAAINNALAAASANTVVDMPAGTAIISSFITVPAGVILRGAGVDATIIKRVSASTATTMLAVSSNSQLEDFTIDGNGASQTVNAYGVLGFQVSNVLHKRVKVINTYGIGFGASDCFTFTYEDCICTGTLNYNQGFWSSYDNATYATSGHTYINCVAQNNMLDGLHIGTNGVRVIGGNYSNNGTSGTSYSPNLGAAGIYFDESRVQVDVHIEGATCDTNGEYGINASISHGSLIGNTCDSNALSGIVLGEKSLRISVMGNKCRYNGTYAGTSNPTIWTRGGITFNPGVVGLTLVGNVCYDDQGTPTQEYGIRFNSTNANSLTANLVVMCGNQTSYNKTDNDNLWATRYGVYSNLTGLLYRDTDPSSLRLLTTTSTTPSAVDVDMLLLNGTFTVTSIGGGSVGKLLRIACINGTPTIQAGATIHLQGGTNFTFNGTFFSSIDLMYFGASWYEVNRSQL